MLAFIDDSSYDEDYDYDDEDYEDYDEDENVEEEEENTEETEEETEVDPMYRDYEILSDFYKKHFVDLRVLGGFQLLDLIIKELKSHMTS